MKLKLIKSMAPKMTRLATKGKYVAPDVAIIGGLALVIAGGIWMGKRSHDAALDIEETKANIDSMKDSLTQDKMTLEDKEKVVGTLKSERRAFAAKMLKTYGPPIVMILGGSAGVICGHRQIRLRNIGLATALATKTTDFANLSKMVDKEHGEGTASKWVNGLKDEVVEYKDEKGKKQKDVVTVQKGKMSKFAIIFDSASGKYSKDPGLSKMALKNAEQYLLREYDDGDFVSAYKAFREAGFSPEFLEGFFSSKDLHELKTTGWLRGYTAPPTYGIYTTYKSQNETFIQGYQPECIIAPIGIESKFAFR